mmetsp:Transcript_31961/g.74862  ORF Transcript_31961/g.74862 Transcript_31961/m.74862 type:complete len:131 (-) Transcript_31961:2760-3152(-)
MRLRVSSDSFLFLSSCFSISEIKLRDWTSGSCAELFAEAPHHFEALFGGGTVWLLLGAALEGGAVAAAGLVEALPELGATEGPGCGAAFPADDADRLLFSCGVDAVSCASPPRPKKDEKSPRRDASAFAF